jgi:hypothetical protein
VPGQVVPNGVPVPGGDTTDDTDEESEDAVLMAEVRREADEEYPPDPEIVDALIEAAQLPEDEDHPDVPLDGDLWTGEPGPALGYRERVVAFAGVIDKLFLDKAPAPEGGSVLETDDLVTGVMDVPGFGAGGRPAMYRMIDRLERAGEAEDRGRGLWWLSPTAPGWLRRELAEATESDDEDDLVDAD